ncbi:MAG TPA: DUF933 domain-containing protein [Phycisphaerae bacterium]|nr:DUF933 domain-containing protein [Phycisphaerae bacterium]HNU44503.1 DUF933 domain-containing protein [Phycisphaerae bacterium]
MNAAIIGLPQSGKSAVFAAITGKVPDHHASPEPHRAVSHIPEPRLKYLADLVRPKKVTEETIEFVDVPGCSLDAPKGQEEWRHVLPTVRLAQVLVVVVRAFDNPAVPPYRGRIDPAADFAEMWDELIFADLETVTNRIDKVEKALKKPSKTHDAEKHELALLTRCREALESNAPLSTVITTDEERKLFSSFAFLTELPIVCVLNVSDDKVTTTPPLVLPHVAASMVLSAEIEAELNALEPEERTAFLEDLGLPEPARARLIHTCHQAGGMITFFTMNAEEARAWSLPRGHTALEAAAKVHTDLARGFIRAETISYDELVAHTDMKGAKAAGKVRKEGKTYVVRDGDILQILSSS